MNSLFKLLMAVFALLYCHGMNAKAILGPVIEQYGPVYEVPEMDQPLPENFHYKAVFDVYKTASENDVHSRRLESVARFINMHALRGVPIEKMSLAVVFHGKATKDILVDSKYQQKFQTVNPNREMIEALAKAGVKFYVCGQTTDFLRYKRTDILPEIKIALSAMTQLVYFQSEGYALLP